MKLLLAAASVVIVWAQHAPALAQSHPLSGFCEGGVVITGTAFNRVQMRRYFGDNVRPELVQAAAFTAAVEPEQQREVRGIVTDRLRANNRWHGETDEILFGLLLEDAKGAHTTTDSLNKVMGAAVGGALGLFTGKVAGVGGGAVAGHSIGLPIVEGYMEVAIDEYLGAALNDLIRNPCQVTAAQVLERVRASP
jgi:hypothetical protein